MASLLRNLQHKYSRLDHEPEGPKPSPLRTSDLDVLVICYRTATCALLLAALIGALGFWVGQYAFHFPVSDKWSTAKRFNFHSDERTLWTFSYNHTFASAPSEETNMAWDSLFPKGLGFIEDEAGLLEAVGVSVFHQLHCLDLLRHLYYDVESEKHSRRHAKHCLDYIRQALICAADSTLEPGNVTTRHVTGSEVVHECRDFDGLVAWTEERRFTERKP